MTVRCQGAEEFFALQIEYISDFICLYIMLTFKSEIIL